MVARTPHAKRQERHMQEHPEKVQFKMVLHIDTRNQLERIARHHDKSITALISEWAEKEENRITSKLTPKDEKEYFSEK